MTRQATPYIVLSVLVLFACLRLWGIDYPALIDWPNHLARHAIQCGDPTFSGQAAYYSFEMRIVPNLTADLVHTLPFACYDIFLTQKILIQFALLGLIGSAFLLHYAIWRRLSIWPGLAALVAFNMNLGYGFENFVLAMPLAIGLLALWIQLLERAIWPRTVVMLPLGGLLYICHLYTFAFFGAMIAAIELQRFVGQSHTPLGPRLLRLLASAAIGALPVAHFLVGQGAGSSLSLEDTVYGGWYSRVTAILALNTPQYFAALGRPEQLITLFGMAALVIIPLAGHQLGGGIRLDNRFRWAAMMALILFLAMPSVLATVHFTDTRFPVMIVVSLLGATRVDLRPKQQLGIALAIGAVFLLIGESWRDRWQRHSDEVAPFLSIANELSSGDRILTLRDGLDSQVIRHSHSIAYLAMISNAFVPTLFNGANPLLPRDASNGRTASQAFPPDIAEMFDDDGIPRRDFETAMLRDWDSYYTHVLVLRSQDARRSANPALGGVVFSGPAFDLYRLSTE